MTDDLGDLRFFTKVVAAGSLSEAARRLNSSPPAMSRRLAAMEARLGVRLVDRGSRRFALTEEGAMLHERGLRIVADLDDIEAEVSTGGKIPRGHLRIQAPTQIGRMRIAGLVGAFVQRYPDVSVELVLSDAPADLVEQELDISFHLGTPLESSLIVRRLIPSQKVVICASAAYLDRYGTPETPEDLLRHNCIRLVRGRRVFDRWTFLEAGRPRDVHVHGTLSTTSSEVVRDWLLAGLGIGLKLRWDVREDLASGALVSCLDAFIGGERSLNIVYGSRSHLPPRMRAFIDFCVAHFQDESLYPTSMA